MVKGKQREKLSKEAILKKVSAYDIYRFYQGPFKLNELCVNHHRGEKDPSLIIGTKLTADITHKDFGDLKWRGDCFHFVEQIFRCDYFEALKIIDRDFGLGIMSGKASDRKVIVWEKPPIEVKQAPLLQVITKTMTKEGWDYWGRYYQGEEDIERENIYMPAQIWRNRKKLWLGPLLTFCIYYPALDRWKIYRPFADKREKDTPCHLWKWDSNVVFNYVNSLDRIEEGCDKAFLTKSQKDKMVLIKALETLCIADVQAEDPSCFSDDALKVFEKVPNRYVISDNDKKGKEFSWWLTKEHSFKHANVPDKYLSEVPKCTDFADLAYHYGLDVVKKHFKSKGII